MDQKKFCFECSTRARYLGLTFVCLAQLSARQKYRSIFELLLLLSDKRSPALCPGPGLLLWDSRVQTERAARPAVRPHSSGLPLLTTPVLLLQKRSSPAADAPALQHHSLSHLQCTFLALGFSHSQMHLS